MKKKETETIRVRFINSYIGKLGCFYRGVEYVIEAEVYEILKADCVKV